MSNPMYEAFLKAAGGDPEKIAAVNEAARNNEKRAAEEAEQARIRAERKAEKERQLAELDKKIEETKRMEKEQKLMESLKPFGYTHTMFMLDYSVEMGVVLAESLEAAKQKVIRDSLFVVTDGMTEDQIEEICKSRVLHVFPIDLSKGICKIGHYYE